MSGKNQPPDFRGAGAQDVANIRRPESGGVMPMGYQSGPAQTKAIPGDGKFPFVKDAVDIDGPYLWRAGLIEIIEDIPPAVVVDNPLPVVTSPYLAPGVAGAYERSPSIDVTNSRQLLVELDYYPGSNGNDQAVGELSLVFQALIIPSTPLGDMTPTEPRFRTIGVVDPSLTVPAIVQSYAMRRVYPSELRLTPNYDPAAPLVPVPLALGVPVPITLAFDVSIYRQVRLLWGEVTADVESSLSCNVYRMR